MQKRRSGDQDERREGERLFKELQNYISWKNAGGQTSAEENNWVSFKDGVDQDVIETERWLKSNFKPDMMPYATDMKSFQTPLPGTTVKPIEIPS